jgi:hypothetical protein
MIASTASAHGVNSRNLRTDATRSKNWAERRLVTVRRLERVERALHRAGGRVAGSAHRAQARHRTHGEEVGAQELDDQGRDDLEVKRSVVQQL